MMGRCDAQKTDHRPKCDCVTVVLAWSVRDSRFCRMSRNTTIIWHIAR